MAAQVASGPQSYEAPPASDNGPDMGIDDKKWKELQQQLDVSYQCMI